MICSNFGLRLLFERCTFSSPFKLHHARLHYLSKNSKNVLDQIFFFWRDLFITKIYDAQFTVNVRFINISICACIK